jgi:hypothetical protein
MIQQDKETTVLDGSANLLLSECASLTYHLAKEIEKGAGIPYTEVLDRINQTVQMYPLVEAGMDVKDAMQRVSLKPEHLKKVVRLTKDGTEEVCYERKNK